MTNTIFGLKGLSDEEVIQSRERFGLNQLNYKKENGFIDAVKSLSKEPMVLLLLITSSIYFISGNIGDGIFLASAIVLVATISLYQDSRSRSALENLKHFSQPNCKVIRNGKVLEVKSDDIVVGDFLIVEEGNTINADGEIIQSNDFSINESILTGESLSVYKDPTKNDKYIFKGTTVISGLAVAKVSAIGNETKLGKIGKSLESIEEEKTPLELQITSFVKKMVIVGTIIFLIVWIINFNNSKDILDSLIKALTLAMSILPEEIPVAFTTFMAIGAWRLMKMGIVVKQMKTVETLGSATVICTDKTGTITENKMSLAKLFVLSSNEISNYSDSLTNIQKNLITAAMWSSEPIPFDPMEIAIHKAYGEFIEIDERSNFKMIHEYPLEGKPPMMTHLFENASGQRIIYAKGAPEAIMSTSELSETNRLQIEDAISKFAKDGYRVLGVGQSTFEGLNFPEKQQELKFHFIGLIAFYDPPKKNIKSILKDFYKAGIKVKIITGDNSATTIAIANQIAFEGSNKIITGTELMAIADSELNKKVIDTNIFTRMFPEAKLKIINALKNEGDIVAMTGDGVNDGPALKAAHIGIAMGKKGTEIAKQAASLILLEDDLSKMVDAVAMGRRIYTNLKKAIRYIISIHIPIILTVLLPLVFGWIYPNIFSPIHVIFLELIMGPTCSIIYENEPMEENSMLQKPRPFSTTFFNWKELTISIFQGLMITVGTLFTYKYAVHSGLNESITRTMVFTALISANIILTLVNRSFYYSIFTTMKYKNNMVLLINSLTIIISGLILFIKPLTNFFEFSSLSISQLMFSLTIGFLSVIWFELIKLKNRITKKFV